MNKINGKLMLKDTIIANIVDNNVEIINSALIPLYFNRYKNIEEWLDLRAIDSYRANSRLLKKALNIDLYDNMSAAMKFNAATITDCYWIKLENDNLTWNDVKFTDNQYSKLALYGDCDSVFQIESKTPELTNIGSFEKCWKLDTSGNWWLYKTGNFNENYSEVFVNKLGLRLGFDMAYYQIENDCVKTKDFTHNGETTLELMRTLVDENDDYNYNFKLLYSIDKTLAKDYIKIIYLDTICFNTDRHTENYGILRSSVTGEIIRLAPNFDNNLSLIAKDAKNYSVGFINYFINFIKNNTLAKEMFLQISPYKLTKQDIDIIIKELNIHLDQSKISAIKNIVLGSQNVIFSELLSL